ncbi:MAG: HWE histidine kinase domain-containing protein, partial [Rhodomicrobium sp.]
MSSASLYNTVARAALARIGHVTSQLGIGQRMAILVAALLLFIFAIIIAGIVYLAGLSRVAQYGQLQYTARVIAGSVEAHLAHYLAVAQVLSASPSLLEDNLSAFRAQTLSAFPEISEDWLSVSGPDGQEIMSLLPSPSLPPDAISAQKRAFAMKSPLIAGVFRGGDRGDWIATVEFPVFRNGMPYRVLTIAMSAKGFLRLLNAQHLPKGWIAAIADTRGHYVAHSAEEARAVGQPVFKGWQAILHHANIQTVRSPEGENIVYANEACPLSGWTVGVSAAASVLEAPVWTALQWAIPAGFAVFLLSLLSVFWIARRITRPIRELERHAPDLVRGQSAARPKGLPEAERIWNALQTALREKQHAERDLRLLEELLCRAAECAHFGAHDYDILTGEVQCSPELRRLLGLESAESLDVTPAMAVSLIYPEDRDNVQAAILDTVRRQQENYELEFRVLRRDGEVRWVLDRGQTIKDPDGRVVRVTGILIDITERKRAELHVAARLAELEGLYRTAPIGLAVLDRDAHFVRVNQALAAMTGKPPEALVGELVWDVVPNQRESIEPTLRRVIENGETAVSELSGEAAGKPGFSRQWFAKWYPVRDALNRPMAGVTVEDVTRRNAAQRQQQLLLQELNHRVKNTLAIVQSIATQTLLKIKNPAEFAKVFSARLMSLARAHDLLTQTAWQGASLCAIVSEAIAPFVPTAGGDAFAITGPSICIPPEATITLALMLHELASNAAKFGALLAPSGRVT